MEEREMLFIAMVRTTVRASETVHDDGTTHGGASATVRDWSKGVARSAAGLRTATRSCGCDGARLCAREEEEGSRTT
ncbi:hypothetical protein SESBI_47509 [Sesbania bispinosa]|nr:hypothetical protein SESBI_47509 [Sesbania bispinosa]